MRGKRSGRSKFDRDEKDESKNSKLPLLRLNLIPGYLGREAKLNRAIFQTLAFHGSQTIYEMFKGVTKQKGLKYTRYASVNKRVRTLMGLGFVQEIAFKKTRAGFGVSVYELHPKAYRAMLFNSIVLDEVISQVNATEALARIAVLIGAAQNEDKI